MIKILVDFDGVWTDLRGQAAAVQAMRLAKFAEYSGLRLAEIEAGFAEVSQAISEQPHLYGWKLNHRLTAFADEDPFLLNSALITGLEELAQKGNEPCLRVRDALARGGAPDFPQLGQEIFRSGCEQYLRAAGHTLLPDAPAALASLLEIAQVVFCTNFLTEPVAATWAKQGFTCGQPGAAGNLILRGGARKQELTNDPRRELVLGGRLVPVDRGYYRQILLEELPHFVVGDVFSIDLALPLLLKQENEAFSDLQCLLARTPFTPAWSLHLCEELSAQGVKSCDSPTHLVKIVSQFVNAR